MTFKQQCFLMLGGNLKPGSKKRDGGTNQSEDQPCVVQPDVLCFGVLDSKMLSQRNQLGS
jgi:hypothetical protein